MRVPATLIVSALVLLLGGCTTTVSHPTKGAAEFDADLHGCEPDFAAMADRWAAPFAIGRCLRAKGWT